MKQEIWIGEQAYPSIRAALRAAQEMAPASEAERVVIDLLPGLYREQLVIRTPYLTLRKKPGTQGEVTCTWYYAMGSLYTSCGTDGFYQEGKKDGPKGAPRNWGASVWLDASAHDFQAEEITFENSFNLYYTQEELADGLETDPDPMSSMFDRRRWLTDKIAEGVPEAEINRWLQSRTYLEGYNIDGGRMTPRERACAFYSNADRVLLRRCRFISKQDTIGINLGRSYFEDCFLAGTTDFICGDGAAVMNRCELHLACGPMLDPDRPCRDSAVITAASQMQSKGYVFYNCTITGSPWAAAADFGRPWKAGAQVSYIHTKIKKSQCPGFTGESLMHPRGWRDMGGNPPEEARFGEYGSVEADTGNPEDLSHPLRQALALNDWTMLEFNPWENLRGADGWDPAGWRIHYRALDQALSGVCLEDGGEGQDTVLPKLPEEYEFLWEASGPYVKISADGTRLEFLRPGFGEPDALGTVTLYLRQPGTEYGLKKTVSFPVHPRQDKTDAFCIKGRIALPKLERADILEMTLSQGTACLKKQRIPLLPGKGDCRYLISDIPPGTYELSCRTVSQALAVLKPEWGNGTVCGGPGESKTLDLAIGKVKEGVLTVDANKKLLFEQGGYGIDLYQNASEKERRALAQAGSITVGYTAAYSREPEKQTYIDLRMGLPGAFTLGADSGRYTRLRNALDWKQLDMTDGTAPGFEGSANTKHQKLSLTGGMHTYPCENQIITVLDFQERKIQVRGTSKENMVKQNFGKWVTFTGFPEKGERNALYLMVYPGGPEVSVQEITVRYRFFVTE